MLRSCGCCTPTLILLKKGRPPHVPAYLYLMVCVSLWVEKLSRLAYAWAVSNPDPERRKGSQQEPRAEYWHGLVDSHSVWKLRFDCCILRLFSLLYVELEFFCLKRLCQQYSLLIVQWVSPVALEPPYKGCVSSTVQKRWKLRHR